MSFITPEKIREIRLRDAKDIEIDGFEEKFKLVKMSAAAAFEYSKLEGQDQLAGIRFMLAHAMAHADGELLTAEEVDLLMSVLSVDGLKKMLEQAKVEVSPAEVPAGKKRGSKRLPTGTTV